MNHIYFFGSWYNSIVSKFRKIAWYEMQNLKGEDAGLI